ncbi:type II secretion system protein GspD [Undibacterium sp. SXout20W]|uniref:type II secretion system protein GspD n=1 Tax=Undibacterium sp. SXout20W TaxID=3413051 RepID=UPI003BF309F0
MKSTFLFLFFFIATVAQAAELKTEKPVNFDFHSAQVSQVIQLVYTEALKMPYVIEPQVLQDNRNVSFRFDGSKNDLHSFWRTFLDSLGYVVESRNGVDFVHTKPGEEKIEQSLEVFVYKSQYRSLSYLVGLLTPLFRVGNFTVNRAVHVESGDKASVNAPPGSAAATIDQDSDTLIFQGTQSEISKLKKLLPQIDIATGEVVVKAVIYEVTTGNTDGTAFSLALNLLGGKLGVSIGVPSDLGSAITFKSASIDAAFSALSGDSRFKAVSTPRLRVKSGSQARLTVGQDVPTLGAVTYSQGSSQAVQSIEYRSSGVILGLLPVVREATIDLTIDQQISDFAKTETGVNNSPTLTKRELSTTVSVGDGELMVLGGLTQDKNSDSNSGVSFLPDFLHVKNKTDSRTEILLLLQVSKIEKQ